MPASSKPILTPRRIAFGVATLGAFSVFAGAVTVYLQREAIGVRLAFDYLRANRIPAVIHLDRLDLGGVSGSMRLGPAVHPDLTVARVQAEFGAMPAPWRGVRAPPLRALRLAQPVLHVRWRDGRPDFGTLQSLIDQALHAKAGGGPPPDLYIRDGRLDLVTPAGTFMVALDATVEGGRVRSLHARLEPADVEAAGLRIADVEGVLSGQATGAGELHLTGAFSAAQGHGAQAAATGLTLSVEGLAPNGAAGLAQTDQPLDAVLRLRAKHFALHPDRGPPVDIRDADLSLDLDGDLDRRRAFTGKLKAAGRAGELARGDAKLLGVAVQLSSPQLHGASGKHGFTAAGPVSMALTSRSGQLRAGPKGAGGVQVSLAPAGLRAAGRFSLDEGVSLQVQGDVQGGGGMAVRDATRVARRALGALDPAAASAAAQALEQVRVDLPAYAVELDTRRGVSLHAPRGVQLAVRKGALSVQPAGGAPLVQSDARGHLTGGLRASLRVEGLPQVELMAAAYDATPKGAVQVSGLTLAVRGSLGPVRAGAARFAGALSGTAQRWTLVEQGCAPIEAAAVMSKGQPVAGGLSLRMCADGAAPLLVVDGGRWRLRTQLQDAATALPGAAAKVQLASATAMLGGGPAAASPEGHVVLRDLAVQDMSSVARFRPLIAAGGVSLERGVAQGRIALNLRANATPLGVLDLTARLAAGEGQAVLRTGRLIFAAKGLQPGDIVPAAASALPEAKGELQLTARAAWTRAGLTSSGEVSSDGFSFKSPAGRIDGLKGDVRLTSLSPLQSAPDQAITAERLETLAPLDDIAARFSLGSQALALQGASARVAGGVVALGPMRLPLVPPLATSGILTLKEVDVQQLINLLNLSKSVVLQAKLAGRLPFALEPSTGVLHLRFTDGRIYAEGPGRLTIQRQALTGAVTTGGAASVQPNAVQDFAYQALENLAFTQLDADVVSRPEGRLGVVFHVKGRHDPPVNPPTRIGLWALLRGHAFDKPLPLPKGTPVDLTLDTSLNLDDILAAYGQMGGAPSKAGGTGSAGASSPKVQP